MKHYCYVYYDENWQATYVGKGAGQRFYAPRGFPIPPRERIQRFFFDEEWQAWECEIELIAFWKRQCDGGSLLNQATGGPGAPGVARSAETRSKISAIHSGKKKSAEHRAKLSAANSGKNNPNYGKKRSAETRAKIGASNSGKKRSEENKARISATLKGRKLSAETRAKMSAAQKKRRSKEK